MSPPSSRQPDDPTDGGSEGPSSGRRHDRTVFEVAQPAPQARQREERRTIFGFARDALGMVQEPVAAPKQEEAQRIQALPVHGVGADALPPERPLDGMQVTVPQYVVRPPGAPAAREERAEGRVAPLYSPPPSTVQVARAVQTPMPAQPTYAAPSRPAPQSQPESRPAERAASYPSARAEHAYQPAPAQPAPYGANDGYGTGQPGSLRYETAEHDPRAAEAHGEAGQATYGRQPPPTQPLPPQMYVAPQQAHGAASPGHGRMHHASAAPLSGPDGSTAFVDMRQFLAQGVELPSMGRADDSASSWHAQAAAVTEPAAPAPLRGPAARWKRRITAQDEEVDLNSVLGRMSGRRLLLVGGCLVALLLAGLSLLARDEPQAEQSVAAATPRPRQAPRPAAARPASVPSEQQAEEPSIEPDERAAAPERAARAPAGAERATREPEALEPSEEQPSADESNDRRTADSEPARGAPEAASTRRVAAGPEPLPQAAATGAVSARGEHVSASPERAAVSYIGGKYKQALAEYRLLAVAYPKQRVYKEIARILKRKIIDTCLRTQPNRREQCKEL